MLLQLNTSIYWHNYNTLIIHTDIKGICLHIKWIFSTVEICPLWECIYCDDTWEQLFVWCIILSHPSWDLGGFSIYLFFLNNALLILTNERHCKRGGWHYLWYQQEEHSERQQHRNAQCHLLPAIRRQVEHQDSERCDQHTGDDQINGVKQRLPLDHKVIGDIKVGDVIGILIFTRRERDNVPLSTGREVIAAGKVTCEDEIHFRVVICPRPELKSAVLLVEREVLHLDCTGWLVDGRG